MDRVLRTILRRTTQLLLLLFLPIAIGGVVAYIQPRPYQSTATIWALHRYEAITATSVDSNNLATPAETQATALTELLQSRSFSLAVAQEAHLASTLKGSVAANPQSREDALYTDISQHVLATPQGYDLFTISYVNTDPRIAQQVVAAVIDNYGLESQHLVSTEGQNLLGTYQTQLAQAQRDEQKAALAQSEYARSNQQLTPIELQSDPQYNQLQGQTQQAQSNVQNIETAINTLETEIATHGIGAASLFTILDAATPGKPVSRLKLYLLGLGTGMAIGILASIIYILLAARRDRSLYNSLDVQKVTNYPVLIEVPRLSPRTMAVLVRTSRRPDLASNGRN